tara:strand:- start:528 stop:1145 length:618 start_codon:yes stop_codon:yes gene_type:complete
MISRNFLTKWNAIRYTIYQPIYDVVVKTFGENRKQSIKHLELTGSEHILISGAGTGLDLDFIPSSCKVSAVDISTGMVNKLKKRAERLENVEAKVMDGHHLEYADNTFDAVLLHLILAVIPDPVQALKEAERVLKPGGKIAIFDKFVATGTEPSLLRKIINIPVAFLATSVTRNLEAIVSQTNLKIQFQKPAKFNGVFQYALLIK